MDAKSWNDVISKMPHPHILQTWEWGEVKSQYGWRRDFKVWEEGGNVKAVGLILRRSISIPGLGNRFNVMYVPKGPLLSDWGDEKLRATVLGELTALGRDSGAIFVKIDPDVILGRGMGGEGNTQDDVTGKKVVADLEGRGWIFSYEQIQFRNTVLIDLEPSEEDMLGRMKQKTRYNVRLARRKGVSVRTGTTSDLYMLYEMYAETAVRDDFVIRDEGYYLTTWKTCMDAGMAVPLIAEVEGEPVAGLFLFWFGRRAWYLHGMSRKAHREKMPNYLLQWEAMKRAKAVGCVDYDLWGAPDNFSEDDPLWGVYRFKEGLGGEVVRHIGAWDFPIRRGLYRLYTQFLPRILSIMRRRGRERTRKMTGTFS